MKFLSVLLWASAAFAASDPVKILVVTGGHPFEEKAFFDMFRAMPEVSFMHAELGGEAEKLFRPEEAKNYDALVFYDMNQNCGAYLDDLFALMDQGKGAVFLHHAIGSCPDSLEYGFLVGGRARFGRPRGSTIDTSKFVANTTYRAHIEDQSDPITSGLADFDVTDEVYSHYFVNTDAHILLTSNSAQSGKPVAWRSNYRKSSVVYIQLGHDHVTYENPAYRTLVERSIRFVAGKLAPGHTTAGEKLYFSLGCAACHGNDARGARGPDLRGPALWSRSDAQQHLSEVVKHGVKGTEMPAYSQASDSDIAELIHYLGRSPAAGNQTPFGNPQRGGELFRSFACSGCHGVNGRGGPLGPELTGILRAEGLDHLEKAVRHPSKELPFQYTPISVVTKDGRQFTGLRRNEDTFSLQMVDRSGNLHLFMKDELRTITHERKSLMPQYGEDQLPQSALADLLAYLQDVKEPL
jgi:hypothetical protein